jgi:plasmid stabilization system protein ParE
MAELIWTLPCLENLDEIADYIALDHPEAARKLIEKVFCEAETLSEFPSSGNVPPELQGTSYRRIVVPPVNVYYRIDGDKMVMIHARRAERYFSIEALQNDDR